MPCAATVRKWALADPAFGAELLAARRREDWMARFAFDEAKAAAFLARARAGGDDQFADRRAGDAVAGDL